MDPGGRSPPRLKGRVLSLRTKSTKEKASNRSQTPTKASAATAPKEEKTASGPSQQTETQLEFPSAEAMQRVFAKLREDIGKSNENCSLLTQDFSTKIGERGLRLLALAQGHQRRYTGNTIAANFLEGLKNCKTQEEFSASLKTLSEFALKNPDTQGGIGLRRLVALLDKHHEGGFKEALSTVARELTLDNAKIDKDIYVLNYKSIALGFLPNFNIKANAQVTMAALPYRFDTEGQIVMKDTPSAGVQIAQGTPSEQEKG